MTNFILKSAKPMAATLAAALMATAVHAGEPGSPASLQGWAKETGKSVDAVMAYPRIALMRGEEGNVRFIVTIDKDGNVLNAVQTERPFSNGISAAAKRVVERAEFPALPASYGKQKMTFGLQLVYAVVSSEQEARALRREGRVSGEAIASAGAPMTASIEILADAE